jgi:lactoylglutathione lyase
MKCFLDLIILLSFVGYGATFMKPFGSINRHSFKTSLSMSTSSLGGVNYRVSSIEKSVNFYSSVFGMKIVETQMNSAKLMLDNQTEGLPALVLELSGGLVSDSAEMGDAYSGFGIKVASAAGLFEAASKAGGKTLLAIDNFAYGASLIPDEDEMKQYPVRYGRISDPDGYTIEVREDPKMKPESRKMFKLTLNVLDIEESVAFYRDVMGMSVLRRRSNVWGIPKHASMCAFMGYSNEATGPYLELHYNYAVEKLEMGSGFAHARFLSSDFTSITDAQKLAGKPVEIVSDGDNTYVQLKDPSDYQVLVSTC